MFPGSRKIHTSEPQVFIKYRSLFLYIGLFLTFPGGCETERPCTYVSEYLCLFLYVSLTLHRSLFDFSRWLRD